MFFICKNGLRIRIIPESYVNHLNLQFFVDKVLTKKYELRYDILEAVHLAAP
jgi:hypothetical protein